MWDRQVRLQGQEDPPAQEVREEWHPVLVDLVGQAVPDHQARAALLVQAALHKGQVRAVRADLEGQARAILALQEALPARAAQQALEARADLAAKLLEGQEGQQAQFQTHLDRGRREGQEVRPDRQGQRARNCHRDPGS